MGALLAVLALAVPVEDLEVALYVEGNSAFGAVEGSLRCVLEATVDGKVGGRG